MGKSAAEVIAEARAKRESAKPAQQEHITVNVDAPDAGEAPEALRGLIAAIAPYVRPTVKPEQLRALVDDAVLRLLPKPKTIVLEDRRTEGKGERKIELAHYLIPELHKRLKRQRHSKRGPFLVGPAGSSKSTAAEICADLLSVDCYLVPLGPQSSKGDLVGFVDAHGNPVWTAIRRAYTDGGLLCLDEIDAANAGVLTILNSLLAQNSYRWPDGTVTERHAEFYYMAAGNTYGTGANLQYIGRNALDAASLDRFVTVIWDYDPELEKALAIKAATEMPGAVENAAGLALKWTARVQALRKGAEKAGVKIVLSTRAIISGAVALADGDAMDVVERVEIWRDGAVTKDDRERILSHV